jgi:hypothetical protein
VHKLDSDHTAQPMNRGSELPELLDVDIAVDAEHMGDGPSRGMDQGIAGDDQPGSSQDEFFIQFDKEFCHKTIIIRPFFECGGADKAVIEIKAAEQKRLKQHGSSPSHDTLVSPLPYHIKG